MQRTGCCIAAVGGFALVVIVLIVLVPDFVEFAFGAGRKAMGLE